MRTVIHTVLCIFMVLLVPLGLSAQTAPVVDALSIQINNWDPAGGSTRRSKSEDYFTFMVNLEIGKLSTYLPSIRKVEIIDGLDRSWTVDHAKYANTGRNQIGWQSFWAGSDDGSSGVLSTVWSVKITMADGKSQTSEFQLGSPDWARGTQGQSTAEVYVNSSYRGTLDPWILRVPDPPRVQQVLWKNDLLTMDLTYKGPQGEQLRLGIYNSEGQFLGYWEIKPDSPWLNGGKGLYTDGRTSRIEVSTATIKLEEKADMGSLHHVAVRVIVPTTRKTQGTITQSLELWSGRYRPNPPEGEAPRLWDPQLEAMIRDRNAWLPTEDAAMSSEERIESWEIGLGAMLAAQSDEDPSGLEMTIGNLFDMEVQIASFARSWNIVDRPSLLSNLDWLWTEGHNQSYLKHRGFVLKHPDIPVEDLLVMYPDDNLRKWRLDLARRQAGPGGLASIRAWDLGRLVYLVRFGLMMNYLDQGEARAWLKKVGDEARETYGSWHAWGSEYAFGRMFWDADTERRAYWWSAYKLIYKLLDSGEYWFRNPWPLPKGASLELDGGTQ